MNSFMFQFCGVPVPCKHKHAASLAVCIAIGLQEPCLLLKDTTKKSALFPEERKMERVGVCGGGGGWYVRRREMRKE